MGFIKMLFFRKEKARPRKARIHHSELREQYQNLLGDMLNDFEAEASAIFREIGESSRAIIPLLRDLKEAELKNTNIPPKEKHFMEGNRLAYIKAVSDFLSSLEEPEEISDGSVNEFMERYEERSKNFRKASFRPGQISSHFFGDIIKKINTELGSIEKCCKKLDEMAKNENVQCLAEIRKKVGLLQRELEKNESILKELENAESSYEELKKEKVVFEQRIKSIEKNSTFIELNELRDGMKKTEEELKILDAGFIDIFLQIEKALKKLPKSSEEELFIARYLENPVEAAISDPELKIIGVLDKARSSLESGAIELEGKKREKLIERLLQLDRETFMRFIISHNDLTLKISNFNRRISQNNSQRDIDDNKYKLDHVQQKQQAAGENIKRLNRQAEELRISELKEDIEKSFETLNIPIEIEI